MWCTMLPSFHFSGILQNTKLLSVCQSFSQNNYRIIFGPIQYKKPASIRISPNTHRLTTITLFTYTL
nr:MAG TPA: hypothetical protein [Caudoviricetes sp.]